LPTKWQAPQPVLKSTFKHGVPKENWDTIFFFDKLTTSFLHISIILNILQTIPDYRTESHGKKLTKIQKLFKIISPSETVSFHKKIFFGNNIAVDPHSEKREVVMSTIVETSRLL
jgi:hypothetical protein